jgi:outer membrane protein
MNNVHFFNIEQKPKDMTQTIKKKKLTTLFAVLCSCMVYSQEIPTAYLQEGLSNNLVLKEKNISLEKSLLALKEAKTLFLPTSYFETQYTLAKGGRSINIPIGDLLNPVYNTLNQLTGSNKFSEVSNVSEQFLPNNFYDVRIKTSMPIINPDLRINQNIKNEEIKLQQNEIDIYKRELVKNIKTAYYNYIMTTKAISIYENALQVVNQNLRANQSLLANGKGLPAYVSRAESEVTQVETQIHNAHNQQLNAQAYFNFLLNKELSAAITIEESASELTETTLLNDVDNITQREELKSLSIAKAINNNLLKMNKSFRTPRLNTFLDLSAQGFNFKVTNKSFFYLGGLQLQIPIFSGKRNLYKIAQSELDLKANALLTEDIKKQLELAAFLSRSNAKTSYSTYAASLKQQQAAQQYFKLIDRGYKEGVNSFIEFLDARNQYTNTLLQVNINKYKFLSTLADYERQTAAYTFK